MLKKLTLAAGFGAGYVLGAKAGREKYTQIEATFRDLAGRPAVQNAATTAKERASELADTAKSTVNEKVGSGSGDDKGATGTDPVIDLAGAPMAGAPMAGAAASGTAPDPTNRP